jgi:DnaJ homolog subfamily C member 17
LRDAASISGFLSPFGLIDLDTIQISLKPPKKAPEKPAKFATVLVEFKQIGGAFAAVCASGRSDRRLSGIQVDWVEKIDQNTSSETGRERKEEKPLPQTQKTDSSAFSSFPEALVRHFCPLLLSFSNWYYYQYDPTVSDRATFSVSGIDYESLTLMRLRQAEKEKLEREIREQETA